MPSLSTSHLQSWSDHLARIAKVSGIPVSNISFGKSHSESFCRISFIPEGSDKTLPARLEASGHFRWEFSAVKLQKAASQVERSLSEVDPHWSLPPDEIIPRVSFVAETSVFDGLESTYFFPDASVVGKLEEHLASPRLRFGKITEWALTEALLEPFSALVPSQKAGKVQRMVDRACEEGLAFAARSGSHPGLRLYHGKMTLTNRSLRVLASVDLCG